MNLSDRKKLFWNNYIAHLSECSVKSSLFPWYVRHCENFIRRNEDMRLKEHTIESVSAYLKQLVASEEMQDWHKKQAIDALGHLFQSLRAPLFKEIDWSYWKSSCVGLDSRQDSHYRFHNPVSLPRQKSTQSSSVTDGEGLARAIDAMRISIRGKNYSVRTEKSYVDWLERFCRFNKGKLVFDLCADDVVSFMRYLAIERGVAPKTQSAALNALSFFFKQVKQEEMGDISHFVRAKARQKLPIILTQPEVVMMLDQFDGVQRLVVSLLYGAGLRIMEVVRLRVQDIDFGFNQIIVRESKGNKERVVPLPSRLIEPLKLQLQRVKQLHDEDLAQGYGSVYMPPGLEKKYGPSSQQWVWQYIFPSLKLSVDPRSGEIRRHHIHESTIQKKVRSVARLVPINKRVTCHTFRHSYATHLLEKGMDIRTIQTLLGHSDVSTTMIYTHLANFAKGKTSSPLDDLV